MYVGYTYFGEVEYDEVPPPEGIKFHVKMPACVALEWYKHTESFDELHRKHIDCPLEFWIPDIETNILEKATKLAEDMYRHLLKKGIDSHICRLILPQSTYIEFIESGPIHIYKQICLVPGKNSEIQNHINKITSIINICKSKNTPLSDYMPPTLHIDYVI